MLSQRDGTVDSLCSEDINGITEGQLLMAGIDTMYSLNDQESRKHFELSLGNNAPQSERGDAHSETGISGV